MNREERSHQPAASLPRAYKYSVGLREWKTVLGDSVAWRRSPVKFSPNQFLLYNFGQGFYLPDFWFLLWKTERLG